MAAGVFTLAPWLYGLALQDACTRGEFSSRRADIYESLLEIANDLRDPDTDATQTFDTEDDSTGVSLEDFIA